MFQTSGSVGCIRSFPAFSWHAPPDSTISATQNIIAVYDTSYLVQCSTATEECFIVRKIGLECFTQSSLSGKLSAPTRARTISEYYVTEQPLFSETRRQRSIYLTKFLACFIHIQHGVIFNIEFSKVCVSLRNSKGLCLFVYLKPNTKHKIFPAHDFL